MASWNEWWERALLPLWEWRGGKRSCPYCFPLAALQETGKHTYWCGSCETRFEVRLAEDGTSGLEPVIPPMHGDVTPSRRTCIPLEQGSLLFDDAASVICRTCHNHQAILLQLLAAFEGPDPASADDGVSFRQYREDLERRYPLCAACHSRVQERLRVVEYKVRSRRLSGRHKASAGRSVPLPEKRRRAGGSGALAAFDCFAVQGVFLLLFLVEYLRVDKTRIPLAALASAHFVWYAAIVPPAIAALALNLLRPFKCLWALLLLLLRLAMVNLIAADAVAIEGLTPPPFLLLLLASCWLLWQLHLPQRAAAAGSRPQRHAVARAGGAALALTPIVPSASREDISSKLESWSTALENLGPTTPLSTRFGDLGSQNNTRPSPFPSPSAFSVTHLSRNPTATDSGAMAAFPLARSLAFPASARNEHRQQLQSQSQPLHRQQKPGYSPLTHFRPTVLDASRPSSLETVLQNFSLGEDGGPSRSGAGPRHAPMDQVVVTAGFVLVRVAVESQLPLVAILLVLALGLRGFVWEGLGRRAQLAVNVVALLRLAWLALFFRPDMLPVPVVVLVAPLGHRLAQIECAADMLVILTR